jgi:hypothetical protein
MIKKKKTKLHSSKIFENWMLNCASPNSNSATTLCINEMSTYLRCSKVRYQKCIKDLDDLWEKKQNKLSSINVSLLMD